MKVVIGSDHAGFQLKTALGDFLRSLGNEVLDVGGQLPGNRYLGPVGMMMEVHATRDVPGLHDVGGRTG